MPIKSFRGLLASGGQETIHLATNNGSTGYRIKKFQLFFEKPGVNRQESIMKIYKVEQTTVDGEVDFSDQTLLGAGQMALYNATASGNIVTQYDVVFDNEIFNQDIYVTHKDIDPTASSCNFYIELEQIKLDLNENTVATLRDIRNIKSQ